MPFSNFTNPYQNPANVPQKYRNHPEISRFFKTDGLESRGSIVSRPSLLNLDVKLSLHPASDSVRLFAFCSCEHNRGMTHVEPPDC